MFSHLSVLDSLVNTIPFCECTTFYIHSSADGRLTCFSILAIMYFNDSLYFCVHVFACVCVCEHQFLILLGIGIEFPTDFFLNNVLP